MAGIRSGLAAKIFNLESRALYTHCYGHALNLAVQDMLKSIKVYHGIPRSVVEKFVSLCPSCQLQKPQLSTPPGCA